jgi:O-antigen ligase
MDTIKTSIQKHQGLIIALSLLYILANTILIANHWYYLLLLPFVLLVIYLAVFSVDKLIYLIVFFVPISLPLELYAPQLGFNLQLPTEPILAGLLVLFIFRLIYEKKFDRDILLHPISIAIYFNLLWISITMFTSTMPLVSFKFLVSRLWFVIPFYFIASQLFTRKKNIRNYVWAFLPLLLFVIVYAITRLSQVGLFNQQAAHLSAHPFFNDHTSYGCILAMVLPFIIGFAFTPRYSLPFRIFCWILVFIFSFALLLSYSRAAWISIVLAGVVFVILIVKIKFRLIIIGLAAVGTLIYLNRDALFLKMEQNRQNSSKDLAKQIESMSNIRTDESNLERLNRWECAFRMFKERPVFGWGSGTYMFQYAPFQLSYEKTAISTNEGTMGNAHSEYLGPLSESGVFGSLSFILIGVVTLFTGIKLYSRSSGHTGTRILILSATLGLITYYVHGSLNDFLDTDKASSLFWGYTAMIAALDVFHIKKFGAEVSVKKTEYPA